MRTRRKRAVSLIEVLIVVAVIAIVAGVVLPVIARSKRGAVKSGDISNLRQLGQAAAIYTVDNEGLQPLSVLPLWDAGLLSTPAVMRSGLDTTRYGICHALAVESEVKRLERKDVFASYPGPLYYGLTREFFEKDIVPARNPGWLVSVATTQFRHGVVTVGVGTYYRLLLDGSVQTRQMDFIGAFLPDSGKTERIFHPALYFVDEGPDWIAARL